MDYISNFNADCTLSGLSGLTSAKKTVVGR